MKNVKLLRAQALDIMVLILVPFILLQVMPSLLNVSLHNILESAYFNTVFVSMCCYAGYVKLLETNHEKQPCGICTSNIIIVLLCIIIAAVMLDMIFFAWIDAHITDVGMAERSQEIAGMNKFFYVIYCIIFAPVAEECLFRLYLFRYMKQHFSWMFAVVSTSVMFGLVHMTVAHVITATLFGILLVLIYEYTQIPWITIVCHVVYNFCAWCAPADSFTQISDNTFVTVMLFLSVIFILGCFMAKYDMMHSDSFRKEVE